ncbi:Tn3 family transposase [Streptomyces sp. NPDC005790]|jgi:hypothetical protein|uniref:Tn3 family transposase n=1 Tax=Streptomyces sp. NPDC005790 TaxID=3154777 RepID=UPI0033DBCB89
MPAVDLPEMVLEVNSWTPFLTDFTHVSEASSRMDDLSLSMAAGLTAEATDVGVEPIVHDGVDALSRDRLLRGPDGRAVEGDPRPCSRCGVTTAYQSTDGRLLHSGALCQPPGPAAVASSAPPRRLLPLRPSSRRLRCPWQPARSACP